MDGIENNNLKAYYLVVLLLQPLHCLLVRDEAFVVSKRYFWWLLIFLNLWKHLDTCCSTVVHFGLMFQHQSTVSVMMADWYI